MWGRTCARLCSGVIIIVALIASANAAELISGLKLADPQPEASALKPGLAVRYHYSIYNDVTEVEAAEKRRKGERGEPLTGLDYRVGGGLVLTSSAADGVGAIITGFIRFDQAGEWKLALHSNDGVVLEIGDEAIHVDPGVHADRFSPIIPVRIDAPGWYPLYIAYFEKRNTSTLELYWLTPGKEGDLELVPEEAFAHLPDEG